MTPAERTRLLAALLACAPRLLAAAYTGNPAALEHAITDVKALRRRLGLER